MFTVFEQISVYNSLNIAGSKSPRVDSALEIFTMKLTKLKILLKHLR